MSGETYSMDPTSEANGRLTIDGRQYSVTYSGNGETGTVNIKYPTSDSSATQKVMFPTIKTKNGALIALYEPQNVNLSTGTTGIMIPDGDGYTTVATTNTAASGNWTFGTVTLNATGDYSTANVTVGRLVYNVNLTAINQTTWTVFNPSTGARVRSPAVILMEGKDVSSNYEAIVVDVETASAASSSDPLGVNSVSMTSPTQYSSTLQSDSDLTLNVDYWGTEVTQDSNTASQKVVTINYPSEQVYANLFVGANAAVITGGIASGGSATELGSVTVSDAEVASVAGKNLIVIGGSCINSVAAQLLGKAACNADFTSATGIAAGEAIIKSFDRSGKTALLVAGYNAADTTKAVTYLTNKVVDTTVGKALKVTSATEATAIAAAA